MYKTNNLEIAKEIVSIVKYIEETTIAKAKNAGEGSFMNPCPFCNHRDHLYVDRKKNLFYSHNGCCEGGTIVDFIVQFEKLDVKEAIKKTLMLAGFSDDTNSANISNTKLYSNTKSKIKQKEDNKLEETINLNFNDLINSVHSNIAETNYFHRRGLSDAVINNYRLGYSEEGFNYAISICKGLQEKTNQIYQFYRYYLPIWDENGNCSYFITRLDESSLKKDLDIKNKNHNLKGIPTEIFNYRYIKSPKLLDGKDIIIIVEGIFDALSVEEMGYKSIALNGVNNKKKLMEMLKANKENIKDIKFILIPDNDDAGKSLEEDITKRFEDMGMKLHSKQLPEKYKDVNDFLVDNRLEFEGFLLEMLNSVFNFKFNSSYMDELLEDIISKKEINIVSTGFKEVDKILGGNLYPGLYTIGAVSSLGKTTLLLQMADNIASQGHDILFFSLEMGKAELIYRSISRESFMLNPKGGITLTDIANKTFPLDLLKKASNNYKKIAGNIAIIEVNIDFGVAEIRQRVEENIKVRGKRPIVIIDYLQMLKPHKGNISEKQANDYNILELKRISRDNNITVISISSLNRTNYNSVVGFESFKETGAIEYTSDVVIGMQLKGLNNIGNSKSESEKRETVNNLKSKDPREIELILLKQRNGISYGKVDLKYYTKYSFFTEVS